MEFKSLEFKSFDLNEEAERKLNNYVNLIFKGKIISRSHSEERCFNVKGFFWVWLN